MTIDFETLLTIIYVLVDDWYQHVGRRLLKGKRGAKPIFSDSEVITLLLVNPPRYSGGYDRMFEGVDDVFDWDAPAAAQFVEQDYARLMEMLGGSAARPRLTRSGSERMLS